MTYEDNAKAAAKWWADKLRQSPEHDNGDAVANAIAKAYFSSPDPLPEERISAFQDALENLIIADRPEWVDADYHPDEILESAALQAGIKLGNRLPIKSITYIETGRARQGYGGKVVDL